MVKHCLTLIILSSSKNNHHFEAKLQQTVMILIMDCWRFEN